MATMIPNTMFETGSEGEVRIFECLRNLLPKEYVVMHSLRWIGSNRNRSQGEADFVIFHPQKGILVLEVKAGIIEYKNREWKQTNRNTGSSKIIRDPEEQASESKFKLITLINNPKCLICNAVWFPSVSFAKSILPPNLHPDILFDQATLQNPEKAIEFAFEYWEKETNRKTSLSANEADKIIEILAPSLHLIPSLKLDYQNTEKKFVQLTQEQSRILDFLRFQDKACIAGSAGTGKTLIAIEKARQLQSEGKRTLFLCYNTLLASYLNKQYSHYGFKIATFDSIASNYGVQKSNYKETRKFFIDYLYDDDADFPFTDIIIDEGQDFDNDWLEILDHRASGCFYVFYDDKQSLYRNNISTYISNSPTRLTLTINCRNTEAIALTSYGIINIKGKDKQILSGIKGKQPELLPLLDAKQQAKQISKIINDFCKDTKAPFHNIAVISMDNWDDSRLKQISNNIKLNWSRQLEENKIHFNTIRKYKGLEADLLIITDLDWNKMLDEIYRKLFYTACSRAKHQLYIISDDINNIDVDMVLLGILGENRKRKGKRKLLKLLNLKV